jgi:hypothetical protein
MFGFFKNQLQDRGVIPVKPIMFRTWRDRFQDKTLNSYINSERINIYQD